MNNITRRIATGFFVVAAPAVIAVGAAATSQAQVTAGADAGHSTSQSAAAHQSHPAPSGMNSLRHRNHGYNRHR